jgi:mannose-6-phosphate isomerase
MGLGRQGKEECWLVLDAEPGATLGVGFRESIDVATLRAGALDGSIEDMLVWHPVRAGDFFYIPANTVHAIGAGVSILEVQQNSDITYRLYDYGRPRPLHLDDAVAVARAEVHAASLRKWFGAATPTANMVEGPYFRIDMITGVLPPEVITRYAGNPVLLLPLVGALQCGERSLQVGQCAALQRVSEDFRITGEKYMILQSSRCVR